MGDGFVPVAVTISPVTFTARSPFAVSVPSALSMLHGAPAPETPRIAFVGPVYGATVPTIVLNLSTVESGPLPAEDACAISPTASARTAAGIHIFLMSVVLSVLGRVCGLCQSREDREELR